VREVVARAGIAPDQVDELVHGNGTQLTGADGGKVALEAAHRRAGGRYDYDGISHVVFLSGVLEDWR
jgi:hypothetical protein